MVHVSKFRFGSLVAIAATAIPCQLYAAEGGAGFYLLGSKGPAAAITPPPGLYFQNDLYFYQGELGGNKQLPTGGRIAVGVDGSAVIEIPTLIWIAPETVLGGHLGLSTTIPLGWKRTNADVVAAGPLGGIATGSVSDTAFTVGDPLAGAFIGWHAGNFHYQVGTLVNIPIGDYQDGEISNISFNHWGADIFAAATWLDPSLGWDLSGAVGMTFNAKNPATEYRTGNEFHFEWAAIKHFNEKVDAGLVGYYYQQVTGDSGDGAVGPFKGRVTAIGATIGYNIAFADTPVAARIKYFHEFATENRAEGNAVFLTLSMPLSFKKTKPISSPEAE